MGVEGTCGRTDLERGQDGGIDLQEALLVQISTDLLQDLAALDKGLLDLGVCDEVNIALTITHLGIGQAVELLGQGAQALGQQGDLLGTGAQLAGLGAEHLTLDADDVAHVQLLESSVSVVAQLVTADVELDVALIVAQMGKACLAVWTRNCVASRSAASAFFCLRTSPGRLRPSFYLMYLTKRKTAGRRSHRCTDSTRTGR